MREGDRGRRSLPLSLLPFSAVTAPLRFLSFALVLAGLGGCASSQPPEATVSADLATAQTALGQAEQAEAATYAALDARNARQKLEQAQQAMERGDRTLARRLAQQAAVDAELAQVKSRSAKARQAVTELQESIRVLREEIERNRRGAGQ